MRTKLCAMCWMLLVTLTSTAFALDPSVFELAKPVGEPGIAGIPPENGHLRIYADPQGTQTCASVPAGAMSTLYLFAELAGETAQGFAGVEFRIQVTNPAGYIFLYSPPPASNVQIGSIFDTTPQDPRDRLGIDIAFPTCQTGARVPMGTIVVFNTGTGGPTDLWIVRRNPSTNPGFPCPWFVQCDAPNYTGVCMGPCAVDPYGLEITGRASINQPTCVEGAACPVACPSTPCVDLTVTGPRSACIGDPITITTRARNCSSGPEDIDLFIDYTLAASFTAVAPGDSVQTSQTLPMPDCAPSNNVRVAVGAVARNATCEEPFGLERLHDILCDERLCGGNLPPDCSGAHASIEQLWPPNGELVPVSIEGVVEPNGDSLEIFIQQITSDELPGAYGRRDCPDAHRVGPNLVELRAERDGGGDGRVYTLDFLAREPSGLTCRSQVHVCVPAQPHRACVDGGGLYEPLFCGEWGPLERERVASLRLDPPQAGEVALALELRAPSDVRLEIYDIRGRLVRTLVEASYQAGAYPLRWDGLDGAGTPAAAGIYFFRMRAGTVTQTAKGVLLR